MYTIDNAKLQKLVAAAKAAYNNDPRRPAAKAEEGCLRGDCYILSEALWYLLGAHRSGWIPYTVRVGEGPHWFLKNVSSGTILDPTETEFESKIDYEPSIPRTFATEAPSPRASAVLERVKTGGLDLPVKKSEDLEKMAISSIPMGERNPYGSEEWDYSHILTPSQKSLGIKSMKVRRIGGDLWQSYLLGPTGSQLGSVKAKVHRSKKAIEVEHSILEEHAKGTKLRGQGLGMAMYESMYAHAMHHLKLKHSMGGEHSTSASATHQRLSQKHGLNYVPQINPASRQSESGDFDGHFKGYKYALKSELEKNQPIPLFPKLGVGDDRRETMIVQKPESVAVKLRQFANNAHRAAGKKGPIDAQALDEYVKGKTKSVGSSTSNGPTINSYVQGTALREKSTPKDAAGFAQHEDVHNVFRRVQMKHGQASRQKLAQGLLGRLRETYPQFHAAVSDFIKVRNGENYKPVFHDEEVIAHAVNFLNNPHERIRYHGKKQHDIETARAFDSVMKRGYGMMRHLATQADPSWVQKSEDLEKTRPNPTFPKLGFPDDRRETVVVDSRRSHEVKIRQMFDASVKEGGVKLAPDKRQEALLDFDMDVGNALGLSNHSGKTVNSFARSDRMRPLDKPGPKELRGVMMHEDLHNIFQRVKIKHGIDAAKNLADNLMYAVKFHDPEAHTTIHDAIKTRNGPKYFKETDFPAEEALAHLTQYVNTPEERLGIHRKKGLDLQAAQNFDNIMKRGHKLVVNLARDMDRNWLALGHASVHFKKVKRNSKVLKSEDGLPALPQAPSDHCQAFVQSDGIIRQCKKAVKASGLCYLHLDKIGHFFEGLNQEKKTLVVASIAVFNSEGYLLMAQRKDSGKWTLPGGKADEGEKPEDCAHRELFEEAGLKITKLEYTGSGWGGKNGDVQVYCYRGKSDDTPTAENDPDEEVEEWEWVDVREGLPKEIVENLHNGKNDISLQILGLQEGNADVELSKSWKHAFVGAIAAAAVAAMPAAAETIENKPQWNPAGLAEGLKPIAHLESSWGQNVNHTPHSKGDFHTAYGAVGLKPVTAHDEYSKSKYLQQLFPDLHDQQKFVEMLKANTAFYNSVATAHWNRLKRLFGDDRLKTAYAWRWGQGKAAETPPELIDADPYVQGYKRIYDRMQMRRVARSLTNPLGKTEQTHPIVYDFGTDSHGFMSPMIRHSSYGTFYEPVSPEEAIEKVRTRGYHGYMGLDPANMEPVLFPEHKHLSAKAGPSISA
jgi:8-oxo-dGTP pyrophosphatase MutT (NUDIX family)